MRKIHGVYPTRGNYVIWMADELGLDYESLKTGPFDGSSRTPEYLAINPSGKVPAYQEEDFSLTESYAINVYLAKNYGDGKLWVDNPQDEAHLFQWLFFAASEMDKTLVTLALQKTFVPEDKRSDKVIADCLKTLDMNLKILDGRLQGRDYLVADKFTAADLTLAAMLKYYEMSGYDFKDYPNVATWYDRCNARPSRSQKKS